MLQDLLRNAEKALSNGAVLTVSVRAVNDVDGSDLSALLRLYLKVADAGGKLVLGDVGPRLAEKLQLTRMDRFIDVQQPHANSASNAQLSSTRGKLFELSRPPTSLFFDRA